MIKKSEFSRPVKVLVPTGCLGAGVLAKHVDYGIAQGADVIATDAGSTDSGPYYLANGATKYVREAIMNDLLILMGAASRAGIPLLIGTCGTCGTDGGVDWTAEICIDVAKQLGISPKIALLYSEQEAETLKRFNARNMIRPLAPSDPLEDETIDGCDHIVALMGTEPYAEALLQGADIVLGGRTTDTAILATLPRLLGCSVAACWHASKVAECGGQCTVNPRNGGVLFTVDDKGFEIEPLEIDNWCSPESVSAHMLYENSDPIYLTEPGGVLDVSTAEYVQLGRRTVRVTGSQWIEKPYTMKLEGAGAGPFQTIMFIGIRDKLVLANLNKFHDGMLASLKRRVAQTFGDKAGEYDISLRIYGWNGLTGEVMPDTTPVPVEVGVMFVVTAETQELANDMARACNSPFFHTPLMAGIEMPSYAFPFSPAEIERGRVFNFKLNHVVRTESPLELVRTKWVDLSDRDSMLPVVGGKNAEVA